MGRRRTIAARELDNSALILKRDGVPYDQIARKLGWNDTSAVKRAVQRALADEITDTVDEVRMIESARLDDIMRMTLDIAMTEHFHVSASGRIALHPLTEQPLLDHAANLQALNTLIRVSESRRKLLGVDAAIKHAISIDQLDAEIRALETAVAQQQPDMTRKALPPGGSGDG